MQNLQWTIKFGANVYGRNKHCGQLSKVVIEPEIWQLTDLIVENGLIFKRATALPASLIEDTSGQTINLKITGKQMKEYPEYQEAIVEKGTADWAVANTTNKIEYMAPPTTDIPNLSLTREKTRIGVDIDSLVLDDHTLIECLDGRLGHLSHLIIDAEDYLLSDLVFAQGTLIPKYYIISTYFVEHISESTIQIAKTREEAEQLPEYAFLHHS
jgi:hypothetical protein